VCPKFQQHHYYLVNLTRDLGFGVGSSETDIKVNQALPSHASLFVKYGSAKITDSYRYTNRNTECLVTTTAACKEFPCYHSKCFKFSTMRPSSAESTTETRTKECHPSNKIHFSVGCKAVSSTSYHFSFQLKKRLSMDKIREAINDKYVTYLHH